MSLSDKAQERRQRLDATITMPVKLVGAREYARALVVATFRATWLSSGGVQYRKTQARRQLDYAESQVACKMLADYLDQGMTPQDVWQQLFNEALELGELVRSEFIVCPPLERDQAAIKALPVRTIP